MYPYLSFPLAGSLSHLGTFSPSKQEEMSVEEKLEWKEKAVLTNSDWNILLTEIVQKIWSY